MSGAITPVKALTFDIGGTVFDWMSAIVRPVDSILAARPNAGINARGFAIAVRQNFLDTQGRIARRERAALPADQVYAMAVEAALEHVKLVGLTGSQNEAVHKAWQTMPAWQGAREAIAALREAFTVVPLTILSFAQTVGSSKVSGIAWDGILACDLLGIHKPDPRCYTRALEVLGCQPHEAMMVASHPSDLRAARSIGMRTAYLQPALHDPGEDYTDTGFASEFDVLAADFSQLAHTLLTGRSS
jgi:2-haloacid dehalogenase